MSSSDSETCWTLIRGAATGRDNDREEFARRYLPTVRAYLAARWKNSPLKTEIEDVVQEVFLACFREGGALDELDSKHESGFRALLYSVARNVARNAERSKARRAKHVRSGLQPELTPGDEVSLSRVFDRAYAAAVMRNARETMATRAAGIGEDAVRRVELLRLRFEEGLPIREIASLWDEDPTRLHREYAKASREFKAALAETVAESERCPPERLDEECNRLLALLRA